VIEVATGKGALGLHARGHSRFVYCMELSASGDLLASAGAEGAVRVWEVSKEQVVHSLSWDEATWGELDEETKALALRVRRRESPGPSRTSREATSSPSTWTQSLY